MLAQKVRALREKRRWTQSDLARATDIPQPTIWRLEAGLINHPKADTLVALARALGVPVDYLVHDDYELQSLDLLRSDAELGEMVETYLRLPEDGRRLLKDVVQALEGKRPRTLRVKPKGVRKE